MRYIKLVRKLKLYSEKPNVNLKQFKEVILIFQSCFSMKEVFKFVKRMAQYNFNLEELITIQLDLKTTLNRIKKQKNIARDF